MAAALCHPQISHGASDAQVIMALREDIQVRAERGTQDKRLICSPNWAKMAKQAQLGLES